tara:strand:+ start:1588 stop:1848 length:261 start_codon:yes stop_codon:yes gene_type:complete
MSARPEPNKQDAALAKKIFDLYCFSLAYNNMDFNELGDRKYNVRREIHIVTLNNKTTREDQIDLMMLNSSAAFKSLAYDDNIAYPK